MKTKKERKNTGKKDMTCERRKIERTKKIKNIRKTKKRKEERT